MDESAINLENILEQAPKWTFAGDFTLLQWMKQISQDLEARATKTTDALTKLNNNIKSTNTALDNVANSLTALQFGNQFVECRVQDDDETLINSSEQTRNKENQPEATATSKELLNTFLDNNLKVLRNCHERYSIDLDDSDDEEISKEKTFIYQPINPYNEKPLPYIFGSKDWQSKWHVGLYENEQENSYSGDEVSEAFSETSSTSHLDDNESFESNTEWASSNSIDNDNFNANIEVKNASSLRGSQALHPGTPIPINAVKSKPAAISESSSVSTTPSSLAKNVMPAKKPQESLTTRSESMNSVNSKTSAKKAAKLSANKRENALQSRIPEQKVVDLFAEPSDDSENITSSSASSVQNAKRLSNDNHLIRKEGAPALRTTAAPFVDLFVEPPEDFSSSTTSSLSSSHNIKRKIVNLFDDNNDSTTFAKEKKFTKPDNGKKIEFLPEVTTSKPFSVAKTSKSLFDDSDDDDDFLKAFIKKSLPKEAAKSSVSKTILFDNDTTMMSSPQPNDTKNKISEEHSVYKAPNLFDATETKEYDTFSNRITNNESWTHAQKSTAEDVNESGNSSKTLSSHSDKPSNEGKVRKSDDVINDFVAETKPRKKINLFDDVEDEDDLFLRKPKNNKETAPQTLNKKVVETQKENVLNIFEDKVVLKATPDNQLAQSDSSLHDKSVAKDQTIHENLVPETFDKPKDVKSIQVDNEIYDTEKFVECPMPEQNDIIPTPQPAENIAVSEDNDQKIKPSNKYEFSSILFSDEPPEDDDDFFETLAKTPTSPNSNYNAMDLENDIFEPDLPKVPIANTNNNQTDSTDNFYTGLQLFNDIPPDDDALSGSTINPAPDANQSKRLHSVFYDDFNETLMALNQKHVDKEISDHSIFNAEPPSMNDNLSFPSKDLPDHKVPDNKHETISCNYEEEALQQSNDKNTLETANKRQVSKLQMPHININVQALLPGASNGLRKSKEYDIPSTRDEAKQAVNLPAVSSGDSQLSAAKTQLTETPRSAETQHILPNMTKNRVKAPAARRPSTRRARQENYRKSLIEQQNTLASDEDHPELNKTIKTETKNIISKDSDDVTSINNYFTHAVKAASSSIFKENENYNGSPPIGMTNNHSLQTASSVRGEAPMSADSIQNIEISTNSSLPISKDVEIVENDSKDIKTLNETQKTHNQLNSSLFFDADEEEDDEDFFKHIKTANSLGTKKTQENEQNLPATSSLNTNEIAKYLETDATTTTKIQKPPSLAFLNKEISGREAESVTRTTQASQKQEISEIKMSTQFAANNFSSFLNDDDDDDHDHDDDDEDLFRTTVTPSRSYLPNKEANDKAKLQFKSFLDSETDEEPNVAGQRTTVPTPTTTTSSSANLKRKNTKDNKAKLFSDSETDSDDLFGKFASTKASMNRKAATEVTTKSQTKHEPKSNLFADESDSDDFLSSKSSLNKNVPKIAAPTNTSLFSDLDSDEDDLFGSGAAKATAANVTKVKNRKSTTTSLPTVAAAETSKPQTVDDNPLADLL